MGRLKFSRNTLYIFSALLWIVAGVNIVRIGIETWHSNAYLFTQITWFIISLIFFSFIIFPKVVRGNIEYVKLSKDLQLYLYKCMQPKSWLIMIIMITLGVAIRKFNILPVYFISGFYSGLGISLIISVYPYFKELLKNK